MDKGMETGGLTSHTEMKGRIKNRKKMVRMNMRRSKPDASSYALVKDRAMIFPSSNCLFWRFLVVFSHCYQADIWTDTQRDPPMKIQGYIKQPQAIEIVIY